MHLCAGSVDDGITVDLNPATRPHVVADATRLPFRDRTFDTVIADPPYSPEMAENLYATPYLSVPKLLKEAARVVKPGGYVLLLDLRTWPPPDELRWRGLVAIYTANRGAKPLRALSVFIRRDGQEHSLDNWGKNP